MSYIKGLVSIIIPVYNTGIYLRRCLLSILKQTYHDLDIILVNDGSSDETTLSIIAEFKAKDKRIRVYDKENEGYAKTLNFALGLIKGEYTMFVDSDDYIKAETVAKMIAKIDGVDLVEASYHLKFEHLIFDRARAKKEMILTKPETLHGLCHNTALNNYVWAKLYRSDLLEDIRFPTSYDNFADMEFTAYVFLKAERIRVIKDRLYYYYQRKGSMTNGMSYKTAWAMYDNFKRQEDIINQNYKGDHFSNYTNYYRSEMMILLGYMKEKDIAKDELYLPLYDDRRVWKILKLFRFILWKMVSFKHKLKDTRMVKR